MTASPCLFMCTGCGCAVYRPDDRSGDSLCLNCQAGPRLVGAAERGVVALTDDTIITAVCDDCARGCTPPLSGQQHYGRCSICGIKRACFGDDPDPMPPREPTDRSEMPAPPKPPAATVKAETAPSKYLVPLKRQPPSLEDLVLAHGTWADVPPEAFKLHEAEMAEWRDYIRSGERYLEETPPSGEDGA